MSVLDYSLDSLKPSSSFIDNYSRNTGGSEVMHLSWSILSSVVHLALPESGRGFVHKIVHRFSLS